MGNQLIGYAEQECAKVESPTVTVTLQRKVAGLRDDLAKAEETLALLEKYPDIQKVLDALASLRCLR